MAPGRGRRSHEGLTFRNARGRCRGGAVRFGLHQRRRRVGRIVQLVVVLDGNQAVVALHPKDYRCSIFLIFGEQHGVPAAVAAKIAEPSRMVVSLAGDGCFLMNGQEFATAVQHSANIVIVVVDNKNIVYFFDIFGLLAQLDDGPIYGPVKVGLKKLFLHEPSGGVVVGSVFGYSGGGYAVATTLTPGMGYWVRATADGALTAAVEVLAVEAQAPRPSAFEAATRNW